MASRRTPGPPIPTKPELSYLFTVNITTSPSVPIGTTPLGDRRFEPITGGSFSGPRLQGKFPFFDNRPGRGAQQGNCSGRGAVKGGIPESGLTRWSLLCCFFLAFFFLQWDFPPPITGNVAPGGADWGIVGGNGVFSPDVAYALQTRDGLGDILVRQRGRSPNVFSVFETGSDEYDWLNLAVAYGVVTSVTGTGVSLEFWQVSTFWLIPTYLLIDHIWGLFVL